MFFFQFQCTFRLQASKAQRKGGEGFIVSIYRSSVLNDNIKINITIENKTKKPLLNKNAL